MWCHVDLARTDVSEEDIASIIKATRIGELGTTLAATSVSYKSRILHPVEQRNNFIFVWNFFLSTWRIHFNNAFYFCLIAYSFISYCLHSYFILPLSLFCVSTATWVWAGKAKNLGSNPGKEKYLSTRTFTPTLGNTECPIHWVVGAHISGVRREAEFSSALLNSATLQLSSVQLSSAQLSSVKLSSAQFS
jgi:uncharacterized protein YjbI with pentapeptide repeats